MSISAAVFNVSRWVLYLDIQQSTVQEECLRVRHLPACIFSFKFISLAIGPNELLFTISNQDGDFSEEEEHGELQELNASLPFGLWARSMTY